MAVFLTIPPFAHSWRLRQLAAALASLALLNGMVVLLSYAIDAPVLYGGGIIPMSIITAFATGILSYSILAAAGMDTFPMSLFQIRRQAPGSAPSPMLTRLALLAFVLVAAGLGAAGSVYLRHEIALAREEAMIELTQVADLKSAQISSWYAERRSDAALILKTPAIVAQISQSLERPPDGAVPSDLLAWMEAMRSGYGYRHIAIYDSDGRLRASVPPSSDLPVPPHDVEFQKSLLSHEIAIADLRRDPGTGDANPSDIHLNIWLPIRSSAKGAGLAVGALLLQVDPERFLYPLIQSWPTPSRTAETILVRREGNEVVFLNDVRHRPDTALRLRSPIDAGTLRPAAMAAGGMKGTLTGSDYQGEPVFASVRGIDGTPWSIVAQVGKTEVLAPLSERARMIGLTCLLLILGAAMVMVLIWRQRDVEWLKRQVESDQAQQELAERVLTLNKHANDIILLANQDGEILEANDRALTAYGHSLDELRKLCLSDLEAASSGEFRGDPHQPEAPEGVLYTSEHRRKDGSTFWVESSVHTVGIGGRTYHQAIARDVTERRTAERALAENERLLREVIASMGEGLIIVDADAKILLMNPAAQRILGFDAVGVPAAKWLESVTVFQADKRTLSQAEDFSIIRALRGEPTDKVERFIRSAAVSEGRWILTSGRPLRGADGRITGAVAVLQDIDERKKLEEHLRNKAKMEALGTLTGGIAHDFNNVLYAILGFTDLAMDRTERTHPAYECLRKVLLGGRRAKDLVAQILAFSHPVEAGRTVVRLQSVIDEVLALQLSSLPSTIQVRRLIDPGCPPILADPTGIHQVVLNLSTNAAHAMQPEGGVLELALEERTIGRSSPPELRDLEPGRYVCLRVKDSGCGMDEATILRIFDPYFTTKPVGEGTGMGLAIVHGIVKDLGGTVTVESSPGRGASFDVFLPALDNDAQVATHRDERPIANVQRR